MRHLSAVLLTFGLVLAACSSSDADPSVESGSAVTTAETEPAEVTETTTAEPETTTTTASEAAQDAAEVEDTAVVELEFGGPVEPGKYSTALLGTEVSLELTDGWIPAVGAPGAFIIEAAETLTPTTEAILFTRMSSFAGPDDFADPNAAGPHLSGDPADFDAWLAASGELLILSDAAVSLGEVEARRLDIAVDPDGDSSLAPACGPNPDDRCFFVGGTLSEPLFFYVVRTSEHYRMWLFEQPGFDEPILVTAVASDGNQAFLDHAETLVQSIEIGDAKAHPVEPPSGPAWEAGLPSPVPAGPVTVPALGGLQFEMTEERFVQQDGNYLSIEANVDVEAMFKPAAQIIRVEATSAFAEDTEAEAIEDSAALVSLLEQTGTVSEVADTVSVLGHDFVGYDYVATVSSSDGPPAVIFSPVALGEQSNLAFAPSDWARIYLADHPDGGVLWVGYDSTTEENLADARAVFDEIVATLSVAE